MSEWDWTPYLVGGATRADAISGLDPAFNSALTSMFSNAPAEIQANMRLLSAYRSPQVQERLWNDALAKYGSPEAARKWVAPPGNSYHNKGQAVDLRYLNDAALEWAHANASNHGLHFPLSNENWHIEPLGTRGTTPITSGGQAFKFGDPAMNASQSGLGMLGAGLDPSAFDMGSPVGLASMYAEKRAAPVEAVQQKIEDRNDDERRRKQALFGGGLASMFA